MRNVLKLVKKQFSDFYFLGYGRFCTQNDWKMKQNIIKSGQIFFGSKIYAMFWNVCKIDFTIFEIWSILYYKLWLSEFLRTWFKNANQLLLRWGRGERGGESACFFRTFLARNDPNLIQYWHDKCFSFDYEPKIIQFG